MGAPRDEAHSFFEYAVALSHAKLDCDVKKNLRVMILTIISYLCRVREAGGPLVLSALHVN